MIRAIEPEDHAAWRALWLQYFTFYETSVGDDVYATMWQRLFDPAEPVWAAVAGNDDARPSCHAARSPPAARP